MKKKDLASCGCKKVCLPECSVAVVVVLLVLAVFAGVVHALSKPGKYSVGHCFEQSDSARVMAKITHESDNLFTYDYSDGRNYSGGMESGSKLRFKDSFKEVYDTRVDCSHYYDLRQEIAVHEEAKTWHESVKILHKSIEEMHEKLKNAHRSNKG